MAFHYQLIKFTKCLFIWHAVPLDTEIFIRQAYKYPIDEYSFIRIAAKCRSGSVLTLLEVRVEDHGLQEKRLHFFLNLQL